MNVRTVSIDLQITNYLADVNVLVHVIYFLKNECISEKDYLHAVDVWIV